MWGKKERLSVAYDEQDEYQVSYNFVQLLREKLVHNGNKRTRCNS